MLHMRYEQKRRTHFGKMLERYLTNAGIGRHELAADTGYSEGLIGRYIRGDHNPPEHFIKATITILELPRNDRRALLEARLRDIAEPLFGTDFDVLLQDKDE